MARGLRHRVDIQHNVPSRVKGVKQDNWLTLETVYASIRTLGGREIIRGEQREAAYTHEVEVRYKNNFGGVLEGSDGDPVEAIGGGFIELSGATTEMLPRYRLLFRGRTFGIKGVIHPYPGRDKTIIRATEVDT